MSMKVYTKTGDKGTTGLIGGTRVSKDDIRIDAYGTVDELNSFIGLVKDSLQNEEITDWLLEIQDRLFTIGSLLATDHSKNIKMSLPDLYEDDIVVLEKWIDYMDGALPAMKSFILPGGGISASTAHVARCVCRRAERLCISMQHQELPVAEVVTKYLNRLSDFLFVLSRYIVYQQGGEEIPWRPRVK